MKTRSITRIAMNLCLLSISAQVVIPIGIVPFTLQVFAIFLMALTSEKNTSIYSIVLYVFLGLMGLPIFSNGQGGLHMITSPTIGFIIGFIPMTLFISYNRNHRAILSLVILYSFGLLGLHLVFLKILHLPLSFSNSFLKYCLVFLPSDTLSYMLARKCAVKLKGQLNLNHNTL